jgi:hypothetical protein
VCCSHPVRVRLYDVVFASGTGGVGGEVEEGGREGIEPCLVVIEAVSVHIVGGAILAIEYALKKVCPNENGGEPTVERAKL